MENNEERKVVGIQVNLILDNGDTSKVDLSTTDQQIIYSVINNYFTSGIPLIDQPPSPSIEQEAEAYADDKVPNANAVDAPFYTTGDVWEIAKAAYIAGSNLKAVGEDVFTKKNMLDAIKYGFEYHRDSMNDDVDVPIGNKLQWIMHSTPLPTPAKQ